MTEQNEEMSRGCIIGSFMFGGVLLLGVAMLANHLQKVPPPPPPPRITIVGDTVVSNPVTIRFLADQKIRNGPQGVIWGDRLLHPHLLVDSAVLMPSMTDSNDTLVLHAPKLSEGLHTIRVFWANEVHANVGDTATIQLRVIR